MGFPSRIPTVTRSNFCAICRKRLSIDVYGSTRGYAYTFCSSEHEIQWIEKVRALLVFKAFSPLLQRLLTNALKLEGRISLELAEAIADNPTEILN